MSCSLTTDIALDCRDSVGGVKRFLIAELGNKNAITKSSGTITAFTLKLGKQFFEYEVDPNRESVFFEEKINPNDANGTVFFESDASINLYKRTAAKSDEVKLLSRNRVMILVQDMNDTWWLMGEEFGATLQASSSPSGKTLGDFNGYTLNFKAKERDYMPAVSSNLIDTLLSQAASS